MTERMLFCALCGACVLSRPDGTLPACACGGYYYRPPALGIWKLSESDRRLLRHFRISASDMESEIWR